MRSAMRSFHLGIAWLLALVVFSAGCSPTTSVVSRNPEMRAGEKIPRPDRILVYDFGATPADVAGDSGHATSFAAPAGQTPEHVALGRELGAKLADELVAEIQGMGLPGVLARESRPPQPNDIAIRGYFGTYDKGSAAKRIIVGFGSGSAELTTFVEGYQMTPSGLRRLGSGEVSSGGAGKSPGLLVPIAVTIATANPIGLVVGGAVKSAQALSGTGTLDKSAKDTAAQIADVLEERFHEQGWIR